jgi:hypothetical protein
LRKFRWNVTPDTREKRLPGLSRIWGSGAKSLKSWIAGMRRSRIPERPVMIILK